MQVLESKQYSNFVNSINSDQSRQMYEYSLSRFLKHYEMDLTSFLSLSQQEISNQIIHYLVNKKISRQYKIVIFSAIKHACEMNDFILDWKKLKKFIKSERTDNSINGKDRGFKISTPHFYRLKKAIKESRFDRLTLIAKTQFVNQHLERIDQLELVNQEMWACYRNPLNSDTVIMGIIY
jgi:hypothetical protein